MNKLLNLQLFAEEDDVIKSSDLEPAISIDFTSRLNANISELQNLLGVTEMTPMSTGTIIKLYKIVFILTTVYYEFRRQNNHSEQEVVYGGIESAEISGKNGRFFG